MVQEGDREARDPVGAEDGMPALGDAGDVDPGLADRPGQVLHAGGEVLAILGDRGDEPRDAGEPQDDHEDDHGDRHDDRQQPGQPSRDAVPHQEAEQRRHRHGDDEREEQRHDDLGRGAHGEQDDRSRGNAEKQPQTGR